MEYLKLFEAEDLDDDDVIENLLSILRKFIRNAGYEPYVFYEDDSIAIQFILNKTETMSSLMKIMNLLHKLQSDILIQYQCEFELAETNDDRPLMTALFWYGSTPSKGKNKKDVYLSDNDMKDFPF
jgi:hypothetical protein